MFRTPAVAPMTAIFCLFGASCQALTGDVDVIPVRPEAPPAAGPVSTDDSTPIQGSDDGDPALPGNDAPGAGVVEAPALDAPLDDGVPPAGDVGSPRDDGQVDAGPPPPVSRPVQVVGAAAQLERVGGDGGQPHVGVCEGGVVIGIRPTANPSEEVFGQRVTLVEPICGTLMLDPGTPGDAASRRFRAVADDGILVWPATDVLSGPPPREVPDPRLVWVAQPPTLCPESAPVLVGLAGEYDPTDPETGATAVIRSVVIECAPLMLEADGIGVSATELGRQLITRGDGFAAEGAAEYASSCSDGSVVTQIHVQAGFWLDGFELGCSSLVSPHLAGEPCTDGAECQSGVCGSAASCEP
jgi:hypothetical protein